MKEKTTEANEKGFLICPHCGRKTKTKVVAGITELKQFPLFCPWCKQETMIKYPNKK